MKKNLLFLCLAAHFLVFAQQDEHTEQLAKFESQKSLAKWPAGNYNSNTQNYNLTSQKLEIELNPETYWISGKVTNTFIPSVAVSSVYFDFAHTLPVSSVTYQGQNVAFQQLSTKELKIDFPQPLSAGQSASVVITYSGQPNADFGTIKQSTGTNGAAISSLSEPYGSQDWFPTKIGLDDKIEEVDMIITTPSAYKAASNGTLISEEVLSNGKRKSHWKSSYPITSYLVAFSVGNFNVTNSTIGTPPIPFVNYLYSTTSANSTVVNNIEWTKQAFPIFEEYFGAYPFRNEKYGHMEYNFGGVCMEHQTMSSMSFWSKGVIAHELAHQWFGDKITCKTWNEIWINEGFAVFGEHLINEKLLLTPTQFQTYLQGQMDYITGTAGGSVYVPDSGISNINRIFDGRLTYAKGGYVVRMMKWVLGDDAFYQALKEYHTRPQLAYQYAGIEDVKNSFLQSTGHDFTEFFSRWLYGEGYPIYTIKWKPSSTNSHIGILVSQTPSVSGTPYFKMPLPIKVNGVNGEVKYFKIDNDSNNQYYYLPVGFPISSVEFNYERQILTKNSVVQYDAALSVNEVKEEALSIYPNPVQNEIFIKGGKFSDVKIYNAEGRLVKEISNAKTSINISELPKGSYILTMPGKEFKFVKN